MTLMSLKFDTAVFKTTRTAISVNITLTTTERMQGVTKGWRSQGKAVTLDYPQMSSIIAVRGMAIWLQLTNYIVKSLRLKCLISTAQLSNPAWHIHLEEFIIQWVTNFLFLKVKHQFSF
jgi:hypothetical protein